jgi:hypothetical protein
MTDRIELLEFLDRYSISHPTSLISARLQDGSFHLQIAGSPFWLKDRGAAPEVTFVLENVSGRLEIDRHLYRSETQLLEGFEVTRLIDHVWAQYENFSIYGSARLPDPLALLAKVEGYLIAVGADRKASDFLNSSFGSWLKCRVSLPAWDNYLLAKAPEVLKHLIVSELEAQGVPYSILDHEYDPPSGLLIRWNGSAFRCTEAWAELP